MSESRIQRRPDVVSIVWSRPPLLPNAQRTISQVNVSGFAVPCNQFLVTGAPMHRAHFCLVQSGFRLNYERMFSAINGYSVYVRG